MNGDMEALARTILEIAQKALDEELKDAIFINGDPGKCAARSGLEDVIKLCKANLDTTRKDEL